MLPASRRPRRFPTVIRPMAPTPMTARQSSRPGKGRCDLLHRRRRRHRDRQDVVDEQRRGRDERDRPADVPARDGVRAAAGRVGDADLAVADGATIASRRADRDADLQAVGERDHAAEDQDTEDLLCGIRRGADRVGAEDGQRLLLGQPLAQLVLRGQRPADEQRPDGCRRTCRSGVVGALAASLAVSWPGPCSGSTARADARGGRDGHPACGPGAAAGHRSLADPTHRGRAVRRVVAAGRPASIAACTASMS